MRQKTWFINYFYFSGRFCIFFMKIPVYFLPVLVSDNNRARSEFFKLLLTAPCLSPFSLEIPKLGCPIGQKVRGLCVGGDIPFQTP